MPNMTTIRAEIKKLDPKQAIWNIRKVDLEEILKNLREANENTLVEVEDEVEDEVEVEIEDEDEIEVEDEIKVLENELTEDYKDFYKDFVMEQFQKEVKNYGKGSVRRGQNLIIYHKMMRKHGTILIAKDREFYTSL